jgi:hypothetical protein
MNQENQELKDKLRKAEMIIDVQKKFRNSGDGDIFHKESILNAITELATDVGLSAACDAFDVPRSTYYRYVSPSKCGSSSDKPAPPLALTSAEKAGVLQVLTSDRFCDKPPYQVYATLVNLRIM